jgi:predicted  nucleic acid-binding Zn-ribbon protein
MAEKECKPGTMPAKHICTACGHQVLQEDCAVCVDKCPKCGAPMHPEHVPHKPQ